MSDYFVPDHVEPPRLSIPPPPPLWQLASSPLTQAFVPHWLWTQKQFTVTRDVPLSFTFQYDYVRTSP